MCVCVCVEACVCVCVWGGGCVGGAVRAGSWVCGVKSDESGYKAPGLAVM